MIESNYIKQIKETASIIHDFIYNNIKLSYEEHATFIAGSLIALQDSVFRKQYKDDYCDDADRFVQSVMAAIEASIKNCKGFNIKTKQDIVIAEFSFITRNEQLKKIVKIENRNWIALQYLLFELENGVFNIAKKYPKYDILGSFYDQFIKHSAGGDQKGLGIVLTPHHIADFMAKLLDINEEDTVIDPCCGSSSLLLTAGENAKITLGVELNTRMTAISLANMIIKERPTYLWHDDCFNKDIKEQIKKYHPTKAILNPPYAQEISELEFVENVLDLLEPNGLCVAIIPHGCAVRTDASLIERKRSILSKHQLLATFKMPDELFYEGQATVTTIIMLFKAYSQNNKETFFGNLKDDGFIKDKKFGRIDANNKWESIETEMLNLYKNFEVSIEKSAIKLVKPEDEWTVQAYMKLHFNNETKDFIKNISNYLLFSLTQAINEDDQIPILGNISDSKIDTEVQLPPHDEWKNFRYDEIFTMNRGRGGQRNVAKNNPGTNQYIGASKRDNGITEYTSLPATEPANSISIANNGSVGACFYHSKPYLASSDVTILTIKNYNLSPSLAMFIKTMVEKEAIRFDYGHKWVISRMKESIMQLPVNEQGMPNWQLMEDYINSLPYSKYI